MPTTQVALASSFVNRVTPANVGGMALNVRYMQKAGVPPAEAVTGVGLNVLAGGIVHVVLLVVFFAWAGAGRAAAFSIPGSSKLLVVIAVVLALVGIVLATRRGRKVAASKRRAVRCASRCAASRRSPARRPAVRPVRRLGRRHAGLHRRAGVRGRRVRRRVSASPRSARSTSARR